MMIKIQNNTPSREPLPKFLQGLLQESLYDLTWTDPSLGVSDCAWWPERAEDPIIDTDTHKYGDEFFTVDTQNRVVVTSRTVVALTSAEIAAELLTRKQEYQHQNKEGCRKHIISMYSEDIQRSAALNIYPQDFVLKVSTFIADCVAEENRVFDLLEAATTLQELTAAQNSLSFPVGG